MPPEKSKSPPPAQPLSPEELRAAYEWAKKHFTAEDLQRYTVEEEGIPLEQVLAKMEEIQRQYEAKGKAG
jgi:hypothetical protein